MATKIKSEAKADGNKITITADSMADIHQYWEKCNIVPVYLGVTIRGEAFPDNNIDPQRIYDAVEKHGDVPKTSAGMEIDYKETFTKHTADGGSVIHFACSSNLSVSHDNAKRAAKGIDRVFIINTKQVSVGVGFLVLKAAEMRDKGMSADEIYNEIKMMIPRLSLQFIVHDLKYLHRGGRVGGLKLLGANLLKIRPTILIDEDGKMAPDKKFKGRYDLAVKEFTKFRLEHASNACLEFVSVMTTKFDDEKTVETVIADLKEFGFKRVERFIAGASITIHGGRNALGICFLNKK